MDEAEIIALGQNINRFLHIPRAGMPFILENFSPPLPIIFNEIQESFEQQPKNMFLPIMGIFAAIDLLAKLTSETEGVGGRFKGFLITYLQMTEEEAREVYGFRNSIMHDCTVERMGQIKKEQYSFLLRRRSDSPAIERTSNEKIFAIDVETLFCTLLCVTDSIRCDLLDALTKEGAETDRVRLFCLVMAQFPSVFLHKD